MRIIKKGRARKIIWPITVTCPNCSSELEIEEEDCWVSTNRNPNVFGYKCPVCDSNNTVGLDSYDVQDSEFPQYPDDYEDFSDGCDISNEEINEKVKYGINYFRENPDAFYYFVMIGNVYICIMNYQNDKDYLIVISKNYMEHTLYYTNEDYRIQNDNDWKCNHSKGIFYKDND